MRNTRYVGWREGTSSCGRRGGFVRRESKREREREEREMEPRDIPAFHLYCMYNNNLELGPGLGKNYCRIVGRRHPWTLPRLRDSVDAKAFRHRSLRMRLHQPTFPKTSPCNCQTVWVSVLSLRTGRWCSMQATLQAIERHSRPVQSNSWIHDVWRVVRLVPHILPVFTIISTNGVDKGSRTLARCPLVRSSMSCYQLSKCESNCDVCHL